MKQQYYIRCQQYKKVVEGYILANNERNFGYCKDKDKWKITDIKTGIAVNKKVCKTKKEAEDFIKNEINIEWFNTESVKNAEKLLENLPLFDKNEIYIHSIENKNANTNIYYGEYKNKAFVMSIFYDGSTDALEYEEHFNENFEDDEIEEMANRIFNNEYKHNKNKFELLSK